MTKEEAYKLIQKQNWYKIFIKEVESNYRGKYFNDSFRETWDYRLWVDRVFYWDGTRQGQFYWSEINTEWLNLTR